MRGGAGKPQIPGDEIPDDGAEEAGEDDVGIDHADVDQSLADRLGHGGADDERGHEVEERGPEDRDPGVRTRVETTVAMELALSWKPLMKSKASATSTITTTY